MTLGLLEMLTILSKLGVDLKAIWASWGIGGIAPALAVKESLTNLAGRMYIYSTSIFSDANPKFPSRLSAPGPGPKPSPN